jgi:hypothetical protein
MVFSTEMIGDFAPLLTAGSSRILPDGHACDPFASALPTRSPQIVFEKAFAWWSGSVARQARAALVDGFQGAVQFRPSCKPHPVFGKPQPRRTISRIRCPFRVAPAILGFAAVPGCSIFRLHDTSILNADATFLGRALERFGSWSARQLCHGNR